MENPYQPPSAEAISALDTNAQVEGNLLVVRPDSTLPPVCLRSGVACTDADRLVLDLSMAASDRWSFKVNGFVSRSIQTAWSRNKRNYQLGMLVCVLGAVACLFLSPVAAVFWLIPFSFLAAWRQRMGLMGLRVERIAAGRIWLGGCHSETLRRVKDDG